MAGLIVRCDMREPFQEKLFMPQHYLAASKLAAYTDFCICNLQYARPHALQCACARSKDVFKNTESKPQLSVTLHRAALNLCSFMLSTHACHTSTQPDTSEHITENLLHSISLQLFSSVGDEVIFS